MNALTRRLATLVATLALAVTVAVKTTDDSADAHAWHYTAMSAATFTLSALLGYIATEAIVKRIRGRN